MKKKFEIDDVWYEWGGGLGGYFHSIESGVKKGDVRCISDRLFYVYIIEKRGWFKTPIISWSLCGKHEYSDVREVYRDFFDV